MTEAQDAVSKEYVDGLLGSGGGGGEAEGDYATKAEVIDNEEVTAAAFADIAAKHSSLSDKVRLDYATKAEVDAIKDMFLNEVIDNEEVVAKALSLLESRLSIIENIT